MRHALAAASIGAAAAIAVTYGRPGSGALDPRWAAAAVVLAGDGVAAARDGDAGRAGFSDPFGVAAAPDGAIFVADGANAHRIRVISPSGRVSTLAGRDAGFADGHGPAARFDTPSALAVDAAGAIYVADTGNNAIRRVAPDGFVSTIAGDGRPGHRDGPAAVARFNGPIGVAVDAAGRVIVADTYNDCIRTVEPDGMVRTLAGSTEPGALDGPAAEARFRTPSGVAVDATGLVYVADTGNDLVRLIDAAGYVTTPDAAPVHRPTGIAADPQGNVYVTDERGWIVELSSLGWSRTLAGSTPGFRDGLSSEAQFRSPRGVAVAGIGRLVVADTGNALIRLVAARERLGPHAPVSPRFSPRFDADAFRAHPLIWPVEPLEGPHDVAGTIGEARGGDGAGRLHTGIDVRAADGAPVYAVRDGVVASPLATGEFGLLNESLRIGPLTYVHIRAGRGRRDEPFDAARFVPAYDGAGRLAGIRVRRGARFAAGDAIGTVNRFNHVHLNVGWPGEEHNPLHFRLTRLEDTVAPTIPRGGVRLYDEQGAMLSQRIRGRLVVSGRVQVVVEAWDQANGNRRGRRLGPYALGYQVLNGDGSALAGFERPLETIRFDRLTADPDAARTIYAPGSGIPFFGQQRTRFIYIVSNTFRDGVAAQGFWDTSSLPPGDYVVRAWVADAHGNAARANRDVPVTLASVTP